MANRRSVPKAQRENEALIDWDIVTNGGKMISESEKLKRAQEAGMDLEGFERFARTRYIAYWLAAAVAHDAVYAHFRWKHALKGTEGSGYPEWLDLDPYQRAEAVHRAIALMEEGDTESPIGETCADSRVLWMAAVANERGKGEVTPVNVRSTEPDDVEAALDALFGPVNRDNLKGPLSS